MLGVEELLNLEDELRLELDKKLGQILSHLNREDRIEEFLELIGLSELLHISSEYQVPKTGKILVFGQTAIKPDVIIAIAEGLGISKKRMELHLEYKDAVKFDFRKTQYNPEYSLIMVGPMPHSGKSKEDYGSVISAIDNKEGYPPVVRLGNNGLKVTKSDFRTKLEECIKKKLIKVA